VRGAVKNAKAFLQLQKEFGSFDNFIWSFVGDKPKVNRWKSMKQLPANSKESDSLSKELKKRGFTFVGSTIIYAHMQACGLVNDHLTNCFRYNQIIKKNK
jgi:DNA-3-methyladenine glycosylase I